MEEAARIVPGREGGVDRGINLVTAGADGRPDGNQDIFSPTRESFDEDADHPGSDAEGGAPPARMGDADHPADAVHE